MNTLDAKQLAVVEEILVLRYRLTYDDMRMEILDHIASETEVLMDVEDLSFDLALKTVLKRWHYDLQHKKLGTYKNTPELVSRLWIRLDFQYFAILLAAVVLAFSLVYGFDIEKQHIGVGAIVLVLGNFFILERIISQLFKSRQKTVFNEYVKRKLKGNLALNVYLLLTTLLWNRSMEAFFDFNAGVYLSAFLGMALFVRLLLSYLLLQKSFVVEKKLLSLS
ncbi:hypothetical protein [Flavobacterium sp. JP2137]|uniref:hypothetical protein n=1 Tax=Flavobacterium sp. JP2137 TaxID=3414510 RepID=UPI003D300819